MKNTVLALGLLVSVPSFAQMVNVNPVVFNFGNSLQIQINNTTDSDINCSGTITMHTRSNYPETAFYSEFIFKGSMSVRNYYISNPQDHITYSNHFINCFESK